MPDALLQQGLTLLILAIFVFMVVGLGRLALARNTPPFSSYGEMIFYSGGIGFGMVGYCVFFLGLFDGFRPLPICLLLIILLTLSFAGWLRAKKPPILKSSALHGTGLPFFCCFFAFRPAFF
jgi:hypothetical protein